MTRYLVRVYNDPLGVVSHDFIVKYYKKKIRAGVYELHPKKDMFDFLNTFPSWEVIKAL